MKKLYPIGEIPPLSERIRLGCKINSNLMVECTGELREPKQGEWYISGAIPIGYLAYKDLYSPYHIAKLVRVEEVKIIKVVAR